MVEGEGGRERMVVGWFLPLPVPACLPEREAGIGSSVYGERSCLGQEESHTRGSMGRSERVALSQNSQNATKWHAMIGWGSPVLHVLPPPILLP